MVTEGLVAYAITMCLKRSLFLAEKTEINIMKSCDSKTSITPWAEKASGRVLSSILGSTV